ncbi:MAG: CPBP family intramembrane metalloprotease [Gemmatimonadales bacterium]|nr:CPBP family intramembrane metalloprotease [Gemmatimonadales bacterium]
MLSSRFLKTYWCATRAPRYSLIFALPLLVAYELLALSLSYVALAGVRNGADVLLKSLFVSFGGRAGLLVFGALLVGTGAVLVARDLRQGEPIEGRVFLLMAVESAVHALAFGIIAGTLTGVLLPGLDIALPAPGTVIQETGMGPATQLMISLGAGIYEELLFRVLLVGGLAWAGRRLGWTAGGAGLAATVVGALIFAGFHYVGPYGDRLELPSFTFRVIAGVLFSALYLTRGFGITAWTHALYDVFLTLG